MTLVDANLLLYACFPHYPHHEASRAWLDGRLDGPGAVGLPWPSLLAFLRLATNARMFPRPYAMDAAWRQVEEWLELPTTWCPGETDAHAEVLGRLVVGRGLNGKLVMNAHLAALAIEHGLVLCSADDDFRRFAGLRFENPLHP